MRITKAAYRIACMRPGTPSEAPPYVPPPLPAATAEWWDCRKGFTYSTYPRIVSWVGQMRGTPLTQPNAARQPKLAYDPVLTAGASWQYPVMYFTRANSENLATQTQLTTPLTLAGTRPWFYAYYRYRLASNSPRQISINYIANWPSGTNYGAGMLYITRVGKLTADFYSNPEFDTPVADLTAPMRAEGYIRTSDGALALRRNGIETTYGSGYSAASATRAVQMAGNYGNYFAEISLAFTMVATAVPSPAELAALYAWTLDSFGGPPLALAA